MGLFWILVSIEYLISDGPFRKTLTLTSYSGVRRNPSLLRNPNPDTQQQTLIHALALASLRPN